MAGINKVMRKPIAIELDKVRHFEYSMESFGLLEDKYGSVAEAFKAMESNKTRDSIYFLWVGLIHEDENLTIKDLGRMIPINQLPLVMGAATEAMQQDMPEDVAMAEEGSKLEVVPN